MPREARLHEQTVTLDGGEDGLDIQRRLITEAPGWLAEDGRLLVETSDRQAGTTMDLMKLVSSPPWLPRPSWTQPL